MGVKFQFFTTKRPPAAERRRTKRNAEKRRTRKAKGREQMKNEQMTMTFREKLNMLLCMNGGINDRTVRLLNGSQNYKLKVMCRLRDKEWIEKKSNITRFTKDAVEVISKDPDQYPYGYLAKSRRESYIGAGKQHARRVLRQGETLAMMIESGIEIYESDISELPNKIVYVKGTQIKEQQEYIDKQALSRSRSMGTIFAGSEAVYNVYTLGTRNQAWETLAESLGKEVAERISQKQYGKALKCKAAVMVDNLDIIKTITRETKRGGGIKAGEVYQQMYLIPKTEMGTQLLGLLVLPGADRVLKSMLEEEGALNFILPDAVNFRRYRIRHGSAGKIWCIKGYEESISKAMPEAEIKTVTISAVIKTVLEQMQN